MLLVLWGVCLVVSVVMKRALVVVLRLFSLECVVEWCKRGRLGRGNVSVVVVVEVSFDLGDAFIECFVFMKEIFD